ncbi:calcium/sodium antiporter [Pseudoalteromonas luteoviolacea]|uniref:Sodium:calcium antiporter n=1 Tax=Pseudoalteromonas luteoviolacea NCIMB 1942 TaxID=1365253 RepID=A0A167ETP6_9GAMM|nr:calcium/sodium antiporter [Pseudoalteromonas luteoviolacea]KZN51190.1 sodium:calcium antiporter [Pseudoalteromonas luteoviolacea NCIMB 1942]KZX00867.1 calcium/sodium:proton antiporter [Pseudoalteromonas luteoviolacea]
MVLSFVILILGFIALVWSADRFVFGAAALAKNLGVPTLIVGLTIVAMGSSAPEMMVAAQAALSDKTDTAVGNAVGSNIANIFLVLGITSLLRPLAVGSGILRREMPLLVIVSLGAWYIISDNYFSAFEGAILLAGFALFILSLIYITKKSSHADEEDPLVSEACDEVPNNVPTGKAVFWLIVGMIVLPISADFLVDAAVDIAKLFGMSDLLIGLTIIAIGTSLPELAACVAGVLKNEDDLALGNIIGSNIFNILAVLSIAGLLNPAQLDLNISSRDIFVMLGATAALILMSLNFKGKRQINRFEGGLLLAAFIGYMYMII